MSTQQIIQNLMRFGHACKPGVLSKDRCQQLAEECDRLLEIQRTNYDKEFISAKQIAIHSVHIASPKIFMDLICLPEVMEVVRAVLKDTVILSSFNASQSSTDGGTTIHSDCRIQMADPEKTLMMAAFICLDDFTVENGCTRVYPFSHRSGEDPRNIRDQLNWDQMLPCEAEAGSLLFILNQIWHDVGPNKSGKRRWGLIANYYRWWIKPNHDFTQISPELKATLTPEQKELLGFNTVPPGPLEARKKTKRPIDEV